MGLKDNLDEKIARFDARRIERLVADPGIIRPLASASACHPPAPGPSTPPSLQKAKSWRTSEIEAFGQRWRNRRFVSAISISSPSQTCRDYGP
jgi:hypothetical protein